MILANLYNKVIGFFRQTETQETESAKETACNRLRVVLMQDRTNLTPELMERMRKEMVELLSKYVEMDKDALELNLEQDGDQVALMLSIPVIRAKDEEEIKAALEEEETKEEIQDEDESLEDDKDIDENIDEDTEKMPEENSDPIEENEEEDEDEKESSKEQQKDKKDRE